MYAMPTEAMPTEAMTTAATPTAVVANGNASHNVQQADVSNALRAHGTTSLHFPQADVSNALRAHGATYRQWYRVICSESAAISATGSGTAAVADTPKFPVPYL